MNGRGESRFSLVLRDELMGKVLAVVNQKGGVGVRQEAIQDHAGEIPDAAESHRR